MMVSEVTGSSWNRRAAPPKSAAKKPRIASSMPADGDAEPRQQNDRRQPEARRQRLDAADDD